MNKCYFIFFDPVRLRQAPSLKTG